MNINKIDKVIYGFHFDGTNPSPSDSITYLNDAVGMTPARMNNGKINFGSWKNVFFMDNFPSTKNIWYKVEQDKNELYSHSCYIASYQPDSSYHTCSDDDCCRVNLIRSIYLILLFKTIDILSIY